MLIDSNLSWKPHIQKVEKLVASDLALLRRIKQFLPLYARRIFYMAFIQTNLDHCSIIWGKSCHTDTLYKLQKRAVRLILDVPAATSTHDLFLKLRIIPFKDRLDFRILTMVIKALNKSAPPYIADVFNDVHCEQNEY